MKVRTAITPRCQGCKIVRRRSKSGISRLYMICSRDPRHKTRTKKRPRR